MEDKYGPGRKGPVTPTEHIPSTPSLRRVKKRAAELLPALPGFPVGPWISWWLDYLLYFSML